MNFGNLFAELKRRNVYKVAVAYAIVGWLLVQVATQVFPFLEIPNWVVRLVIALVAIGFPIALVTAWAFELTPEGIKRTEDVDLAVSAATTTKACLDCCRDRRSRALRRFIFHWTLHSAEFRQCVGIIRQVDRGFAVREHERGQER